MTRGLVWREVHWRRPLDLERCEALLRRFASDGRSPKVILEARAADKQIRYLVGTAPADRATVDATITSLVPDTSIIELETARKPVNKAGAIKLSTRHRALRTGDIETTSRDLLAALALASTDEELVLQIILGPRRAPLSVATNSPSSTVAPWWSIAWYGKGDTIDSEKRGALRDKVNHPGFACAVRIGVTARISARRQSLMKSVLAALRTLEAPAVQIRLTPAAPKHLASGRTVFIWPLRCNVHEVLAILGWPIGEAELPGHPPLHPRILSPAPGTVGVERVVAASGLPGPTTYLSLPVAAATRHTVVLGPTGVGKSVLLSHLIVADIAAGHGVVVVDPKGDLVDDVLARIPAHRQQDVVVLDPDDPAPVGLNPLHVGGRSPDVVADGVLSVFKTLYADALGPRMIDVVSVALMTLARRRDASLVMLPVLLTNPAFRRELTTGLNDPIALGPFWSWYESLSDSERAAAIAPVMSRMRQWLLHRKVRAVLGQQAPRFQLDHVFSQQKVLLVPLRNGVIGKDAARLLGSLFVAQLWQTIEAQAAVPQSQRKPVMVYLDEAPQLLATGADLGAALALARGLGCGFTLVAQLLGQFDKQLQAGILTNARSRILFQLSHEDAVTMSRGHPEVMPEDITSLGAYEVYASLFSGGRSTPYAFGRTLPPTGPTADVAALRTLSREHYGRPTSEIEAAFTALFTPTTGTVPTGRRRRA